MLTHPVHPATSPPSLSPRSSIARWLAAATLAHDLLLLIPSQRDQPSSEGLPTLVIALLRAPPPAQTARELDTRQPSAESAQERPRGEPPQEHTAAPRPVPNRPPDLPMVPVPERPQPSTAYLLDLAGRRQLSLPETSTAPRLGEHVPRPMPPNWRSARRPEANRFDGMVAPAEVEIVDRWLAADGSQNVVITTPDGETYCGRAEAWNPMTPLVEPIMTYRNCGGGGQRTFDMPHPSRRRAAAGERP